MKAYYRHEMRNRVIQQIDEATEKNTEITANDIAKQTSLLDAIHLIRRAWKNLKSQCRNCFKKGGFINGNEEPVESPPVPADLTEEQYNEWMSVTKI